MSHRSRHRLLPILVGSLLLITGLTVSIPETAAGPPATYQNPVSTPDASHFGSPSVIRGRDGAWYAFGPGNPLNRGEDRPLFPIMRSTDLVAWEYVGDVFTPETFPAWKGNDDCCLWAPAIEYADGEYRLYFTLRGIEGLPLPNTAIGVATAPTPLGPWTDSGEPLVEPRQWTPPGRSDPIYRTIIDADVITAPDGTRYLYYGGFGGGIYAHELAADGKSTVGPEVQLTTDSTYEGPYVIHRDGWYYLMASSGHCCRGPVSGYSVWVGRSRDPLGPFVDKNGVRMDARSPGGTPVLAANGNTWIGVGHNAVIPDLAGQDWTTFNGIDREDPWFVSEGRGTLRPMLIDRLDWIDGWPTVNAGAWASESPRRAPAVRPVVGDAFEGSTYGDWRAAAGWHRGDEPAGGYLSSPPGGGERFLDPALTGSVRLRGAVRLGTARSAGLTWARGDSSNRLTVTIDRDRNALVADFRLGGSSRRAVAPLPATFSYHDWHEVDLEIDGTTITASVSDAGLYDPVAITQLEIPDALRTGTLGVLAHQGSADFDDLSGTPLATPTTEPVPDPVAGEVTFSEEFDDELAPGWEWVRETVADTDEGRLRFPVQVGADVNGRGNDASVLLRDTSDDVWIAETKLTLDYQGETYRGFPQAGLIAYVDDDDFLRLTARAHRAVEITTFSKEITLSDGRPYANAGEVGPSGSTTWLRLAHRIDPDTGEHELRAGTSLDGQTWTWGGVLTLASGSDVKLGLAAHGAAEDRGLVADFDYLRMHRATWSAGTP